MKRKLFGAIYTLNAIIFLFQAMTKFTYPPLVIPFREAFDTDNAGAGLLVTLVFLGYALARFPSGIMADRLGCARTILWGSGAMSIGFLVISLATNYTGLAIFTFILGVSSGVYVTAGYTLAVIIGSRSHAAFATAYFETFGSIAAIGSPLVVSFFVLNHSWRSLFILLGMILIVITVLFYIAQKREQTDDDESMSLALWGSSTVKNSGSSSSKNNNNKNVWVNIKQETISSLAIFKEQKIRRIIIWSTLVGGLSAASWMGIYSFIPTYLVDDKGMGYENANQVFALVAIASLFSKLILGYLADRLGTIRVMLFAMVSGVLLYTILTFLVAPWTLVLILICIGIFSKNTNMLINSYVLRCMPEKYQGTGFGLFCTIYTVVYSFGPYITGQLAEVVGLSAAILISLTGAVAAIFLIIIKNKLVHHGDSSLGALGASGASRGRF